MNTPMVKVVYSFQVAVFLSVAFKEIIKNGDNGMRLLTYCLITILCAIAGFSQDSLLPAGWNALTEGDKVLSRLVNVTGGSARGTHDAEFVIVEDRAYIVAEANDERPGHGTTNDYVSMSIVDMATLKLEQYLVFARAGQAFDNETLPAGRTFVPRIIQLSDTKLRCYFNSQPPKAQEQIWIIDFDIPSQSFARTIRRAKLKTATGVVDMQPQHFHADAARHGFTKKPTNHGMYIFDTFKKFDGKLYTVINNFPGGQNALALVNEARDSFEIIGHYNEPLSLKITESAVNRLPDGTWMAICRQTGGNNNYLFTTSRDGRSWTPCEERPFVRSGASSKPIFECFNGIYYLGWQENSQVNNIRRTVFNIDVSRDGKEWLRKYRFEVNDGFTYPTLHEHNGAIYMSVSLGVRSGERIGFGKLEDL